MNTIPHTTISTEEFNKAILSIDTVNNCDPDSIFVDGQKIPKELAYSQFMTQTLAELFPKASYELQIAVRGHHIERWTKPRKDWPDGRIGYLKWRKDLYGIHALKTAEILRKSTDISEASILRITDLIKKKNLSSNPECVALEDTACIVFLKYYLDDFIKAMEDQKVISIIAKTWTRMSPVAKKAAPQIVLGERATRLLKSALET